MADKGSEKKRKHPAKRFAIPADIRALGGYGVVIVDALRAEYRKRMSGSKTT